MRTDHDELDEVETSKLLELIRERAYQIFLAMAAVGRYQSPQDDWLAAEAEIQRELKAPCCRRPQDHRGPCSP